MRLIQVNFKPGIKGKRGEESKKKKPKKTPSKTSRQTNKETYNSIYEEILISNLQGTNSLKVDFT